MTTKEVERGKVHTVIFSDHPSPMRSSGLSVLSGVLKLLDVFLDGGGVWL